MSAAASSDTLQRLGPYEIVRALKSGGMARLYLARREGLGGFSRSLALKTVHAHLAHDESFVQMFLDEARLAAQLSHPNIVQVEDVGEVDGVYFMAMELVRGVSHSQILKAARKAGERVPPEVTVRIGMEVAAGLHAAHTAIGNDGQKLGVVHRDVSPQNIMVSWSGQVKLLDFGIAKAAGTHTSGDTLKGKLRYMPPEQARGKPVDGRTDLYALAVVMWESVTGLRRFTGDSDFEILDRVRDPKPKSARGCGAPISEELDAVLNKALRANPDERYASSHEFKQALSQTPEAGMTRDALGAYTSAQLHDEKEVQRQQLPASSPSISRSRPVEPPTQPAVQAEAPPASRKKAMIALVALAAVVGTTLALVVTDEAPAAEPPAQAGNEPTDEPLAPVEPTPVIAPAAEPVVLELGEETTLLQGERVVALETAIELEEILNNAVRIQVNGEQSQVAANEAIELGNARLAVLWADATVGAARFRFEENRLAPARATRMRARRRQPMRASSMMGAASMMSASAMDDFSAGVFEGRMRALPVTDF